MLSIDVPETTVEQRIMMISNHIARDRCMTAYHFLMNNDKSSYRMYVEKHKNLLSSCQKPLKTDIFLWEGIECALWPTLYPLTDWCESLLGGSLDRSSCKISFLTKCLGPILDYSQNYNLLHFIFDKYMFKTITGAINTAKHLHVSPFHSLSSKSFSPAFWEWQHRHLLDVVRQFGLPTLFITFSPSEWTFPAPQWLLNVRDRYNLPPTKTALFETIHFAHVLEQIVKGYMCGTNNEKWTSHLFHYNHLKNRSSVITYFYRFEFQGRGTLHMHLLVWLNNCKYIDYSKITATLPNVDDPLYKIVKKHQCSDTPSPCLKVQNDNTFVHDQDDTIHIHCPADAFALNMRAYISSLLPALQCSMDVQCSNGKGMLLKICHLPYFSKWQNTFNGDSLFNRNIHATHIALQHLITLKVCEPVMWFLLLQKNICHFHGTKVQFTPPLPKLPHSNQQLAAYYSKPSCAADLSLITFLRQNNTSLSQKQRHPHSSLSGCQVLLHH